MNGYILAALTLWAAAAAILAWGLCRAASRPMPSPVAPVEWDGDTFLALVTDEAWLSTLADLDDDDALAALADGRWES